MTHFIVELIKVRHVNAELIKVIPFIVELK